MSEQEPDATDIEEPQEAEPEAQKLPPKMPAKRRSFSFDRDEVIKDILKWYEQDMQDRLEWSERRLQRTAKLRGWLEAKDYPWPDASNVYIPLMMTDSLQMQDTLHNGVMSQRPVMSPQAVNPADREKTDQIADLLDYQVFVEQQGEEKIASLIESFVNDGTMYSLQAWVKDEQDTEQVETYPALDPAFPIDMQLRVHLERVFSDLPTADIEQKGKDPFVWSVAWIDENRQPHTATAEFYTHDDGRLLCIIKRKVTIFDGPCLIPKTEEDIIFPSRADNLQPPSPSNPGGAHHVILVDYPSIDEIKRLVRSKYYDMPTKEEMELLDQQAEQKGAVSMSPDDNEQHRTQRDQLAGQTYGNAELTSGTYTRLMVFARWDVDGDGLDENVVFWVLKEAKLLLRARLMQEMFPSKLGKRPLMSEQFIPVPGQIRGIGLLELLEHIQDAMKILVDQTIDRNTLVNTPWFFFRPTAGVRPETIRMAPGEGYPVSDPQRDVAWSQPPQADPTSLNLLAIFNQWAERQAVIGELQFGRIPQGKSSALRTTGGMMSVLQQGAARPERIIRRFFMGLAEAYSQLHELNGIYLQPKKQYRVLGMSTPGADPYRTVDDPSKVRGEFKFEFKANSLNTNKAVRGQILQQLGAMTFNPMTFQMGMVTKENYYNWLKDIYAESGQDPNRYVNPPTPQSAMPKITAEQAIGLLYQGYIPKQLPTEGPQVHLARLDELVQQLQQEQSIDASFMTLLNAYKQKVQAQVVEAQQMAMQAGQFASMLSGGGGGSPPAQGDGSGGGMMPQPQGQLMDESLPSNQSVMGQF